MWDCPIECNYCIPVTGEPTAKPSNQPGAQKISNGDLSFTLEQYDSFGTSVATADFNLDGIQDLVVGSCYDNDGALNAGAVHFSYDKRRHRGSIIKRGSITKRAQISKADFQFNG